MADATNIDLLEWFDDGEQAVCSSCNERTAVSLPDVAASFCLRCGAISVGGMRIDMNRVVPTQF